METVINQIIAWLSDYIWQIIAIIIALIVGRWTSRMAKKRLRRALKRREVPQSFIRLSDSIAPWIVWFLVVLVVLALLGVPVNSLLFGAAIVLALISIAMRESIGNFAATVNFWLFRPFKVGHMIETGQTLGTVQELELFTTVIHARDNKIHVLPNSSIMSNGLINYSRAEALPVDLVFNIDYCHDVVLAKELLLNMLLEDERVLKDPPPIIFVQRHAESWVDIGVRPYVTLENYWAIQGYFRQKGQAILDTHNMRNPNIQTDIYISNNPLQFVEERPS